MNPALQYRNYGKSLKRVLIPALQYRNFENAKKKVIDSIALLRPPSSDRTTVSQILSFCTLHSLTLGRRRFEGFGQNPSRTEGKSMVFTASRSDLPCPSGDARLARGSMSLYSACFAQAAAPRSGVSDLGTLTRFLRRFLNSLNSIQFIEPRARRASP